VTFQFFLVLLLALLSVAYFLKDLLRSAVSGGCSSGCGGCKTGGCPVKKLETLQSRPESPRRSA
jgi:hypothetical protein